MTSDADSENKLIAERRRKLDQLRESGNAYPNDFRRSDIADALHAAYGKHSAESLADESVGVAVAGRLMAKRVMGKSTFVNTISEIEPLRSL